MVFTALFFDENIIQAIEFETHLGNGLMQVPLIYHHWHKTNLSKLFYYKMK